MRILRRSTGEAVVIAHSYRNRSLGTFLLLLGVIGGIPLWYFLNVTRHHHLHTLADYYPGFAISGVVMLIGYLLARHSHKVIIIRPGHLTVKESLFARPMHIEWSGEAFVRLQHLIDERKNRAGVLWLVKLGHERSEYTVDEREDQQVEARGIAETIAKTLRCPLIAKDDSNQDVVIASTDLDLPFRQRVQKYPALMGKIAPQPAAVPVEISGSGTERHYRWGVRSSGLILDILVLTGIFIILSMLPLGNDRPSAYESAVVLHNYTVYLAGAAIVGLFLLLAAGVSMRLDIDARAATLTEKMWGLPFTSKTIPLTEIEEINLYLTMRGPVVQLVSDRNVLEFRVSDAAVAAWLTSDIRAFLGGPAA
jgi:hypothetical protein